MATTLKSAVVKTAASPTLNLKSTLEKDDSKATVLPAVAAASKKPKGGSGQHSTNDDDTVNINIGSKGGADDVFVVDSNSENETRTIRNAETVESREKWSEVLRKKTNSKH